jgi:hypothetical protein
MRFSFSKQMADNPAEGNPNQEGTSEPGNIRSDRYFKLTLSLQRTRVMILFKTAYLSKISKRSLAYIYI